MKRAAAILVALVLAACHHNEQLADAAAEGNAAAQYEYGRRMLAGEKGVRANPQQAALWLTAASCAGTPGRNPCWAGATRRG